MKKIALVLPEAGPVPAVKGGAIEELLTILVEQNEIEHRVQFMVFCADNEQARAMAEKYTYSKIRYIPKTTLADRLINRVIRYSNRIIKNKTWIDIAYYRRVFRYLKEYRPDAIVAEGGLYHEFKRFAQEFGKENVYLHIHHHLLCEPYIDHIYGSVIGISQFATREWMRTTEDKDVKAYTVYNCVNEDKFKKRITPEERERIRGEFGFKRDDTILLFCGRIIEVKGVRELLQAVINLKRPDIKLLMIGSAGFGGNVVTPYVQEVQKLVEEVRQHIKDAGIPAQVDGRAKHFFSIYKKMVNQHKTLDQIYDLFAIRIIVDSVKDCYAALGVIHEMYKPIPGRFKDYIAMPKPNMYQSLHTPLIGPTGQPFEIQIRTFEMHRTAEYGIAAHWKYKEASNNGGVSQPMTVTEEEKLSWLRQILEWQRDMSDNKEFMSLLKSDLDLFSDTVFCFTPTGDVKALPSGSTPIDFAYSIHTAVGNKMVGARVNGKLVNIDYVIQNGDRIEVITSQNSKGPSRDWLSIVKSTQAKNKINQWFRSELKEENILHGKELINNYAKAKGINFGEINKPEYQGKIIRKYGFHDWNSCLATVGHGGLKESQIVNRMYDEYRKDHPITLTDQEVLEAVGENKQEDMPKHSKSGIVVKGLYDVAVHFSKCCSPVRGDEIVGFVTRGRGVSIHRTDCFNILHLSDMERVRLIEAEWQEGADKEQFGEYHAEIKIFCHDRSGLLVDITKVFTEAEINISGIHSKTSKQGIATIDVAFQTKGKGQITKIVEKIRQIESVMDVERTTG